MDFDRENSNPGQKNFQIQGSSWIPATPIKPIVQRHQPIYANQHPENQNWERSECLSTGFSLDNNQSQRIVSSFHCTNDLETNRYVGHWQTERIPTSGNISGGNPQVGNNPMAGLENLPFVDLLAQFDMGNTSQAGSIAPTSPCDFGYNIQTGSNWPESVYGNSLATNQNQPLGSLPWADHTWVAPQRTQCEIPVPCRQTYDLNVIPGAVADELPRINTLQFDPTTPNKRISQVIQNTTRDETIEPHQDKNFSWADSSFPADTSAITENQNNKNGCDQVIDLNATPQQKPRRRKHRPKVIKEGKPKRVRKPAVPKPDASKETPRVKRKYVRKNGLNKASTPAPPEVAGEFTDPKPVEAATKATRRSLNFESDGQTRNEKSILNSANVDPESHEQQQFCSGRVQSREPLHLNDYVSWHSRQAPSAPSPSNINIKANTQLHNDEETVLISSKVLAPISPNDSNCSTTDDLDQGQTTAKKRQSTHVRDMEDPSTVNINGVEYNGMHLYEAFRVQDFNNRICAEIYKKRRTEKGQTSTTSSTSSSAITAKNIVQFARDNLQSIDAPQLQMNKAPRIQEEAVHVTAMHKVQVLESMQDLDPKERNFTKKRSNAPTRVRDLASLIGTSHSNWLTTSPGNQVLLNGVRQGVNTSHGFRNCQDALFAENSASFTKGKRSKKPNSFISSMSSSRNVVQMHQNNFIYTQNKVLCHRTGPPPQVMWKHMLSVDAITEKLRQLNINMGGKIVSYQEYNALVQHQTQNAVVQYQPQNALVPYRRVRRRKEKNALVVYRRDGTVVPFDGSFYPTKKRIPRPKVDLDEETNKVWMLLLENINNEGINGTDEQKAKWWEEERRVFCGRADSFIARMHLVQGDRRFSKWKGSVVDSVVGVFLTQNVSDHLSSSAFMSMAAHFPLKSKSNEQEWYDEGTSTVVDEPELCVLELEDDTIKTIPDSLICDQSSMTLNDPDHKEETEGVNSIDLLASSDNCISPNDNCISSNDDSRSKLEFFGSDLESFHESTIQHMDKETTYIVEDVISSQSSVDSSIAQTAEIRPQHFSKRNPDAQDLTTERKRISFDNSPSFLELLHMAVGPNFKQVQEQRSCLGVLDGPESSIVAPDNHHSTLTTISRSQEVDCIEILDEDTRSSEFPNKNDEIRTSNGGVFTKETSNITVSQSNLRDGVQEFPKVSTHNVQTTRNCTTNSNGTEQPQGRPLEEPIIIESFAQGNNIGRQQNKLPNFSGEISDVTESTNVFNTQKNTEHKEAERFLREHNQGFMKPLNETSVDALGKRKRVVKEKKAAVDWDNLRKQAQANGVRQKSANTMDSVDWEAVRCADVSEIANTIKERGMNNMLAERIQAFLNRLVRDHESLDLEWLRDVPPDKAKEYLLSVRGLGLKSVECIRLLTLHHLAFPVDTNVGRIAVRLGWVPLQPLPESLQLHLLELYPVLESIQKYLWPRLCKLDQKTLYELHYQMITFGKVFCTKSKPNCNACPMRGECRHFASAFASARLALPGPEEKSIVTATENIAAHDADIITNRLQLPPPPVNQHSIENNQSEAFPPPPVNQHSITNGQSEAKSVMRNNEPIVEEPATPEPEYTQITESDIEDACCEDPDEIPTIKLNIKEFTHNLQDYMQKNMELQEGDMSRALVALTEAATLPTPKLKNISRLRTEHQVYELPDSHPLLQGMDKREPDDPSSYLLAIWTPGETSNTIHQPEGRCTSQETGKLCSVATCFSCNSIREANSQTVRGTLLIPCRTAMRGSFPLNGTYFQVNEVFADHASSICPIDVPTAWIWNLPRRTVYFGTSIPSIFKGLTTEGIQYCFWRGFVCVRGFDQLSRAPRPLIARLHFPASKLVKTKATTNEE